MKLFFGGAVAAALWLATGVSAALAQSPAGSPAATPADPAKTNPAAQTAPDAAGPVSAAPVLAAPRAQSNGKVIFSRSIDENGETVTSAGPAAHMTTVRAVDTPQVDDDDRRAVTFTAIDLDVHLHAAEQRIAVRAQLTVRNDGKRELGSIPLQVSSSLEWERIEIAGRDAAFTVATLNSDTDHTGQLHEAAAALAEPLAPGATLRLDVRYSGTIQKNAKRLLAIGTPEDAALNSDWDEIGPEFTGLRGFGNVVWYPVSSVPVVLGDGARVFDEIGRHKLSLAGARFRLQVAAEYSAGEAPTVALVNGRTIALSAAAAQGEQISGVATARTDWTTLGFESPSLFVAARTAHDQGTMALWTLPEDAGVVDGWTAAAATAAAFVRARLGQDAQSQLTILDLPAAKDAPFEAGSLLAISVRAAPAGELQAALVHAMAHSFRNNPLRPAPAWLDEGVAAFVSAKWTEKQQGHDKALETLEAARPALALVEPASPGESAGHPLATAISPVYYRTKAAYVLWMLDDIAGEPALSAALHGMAANTEAARSDAARKTGPGGSANAGQATRSGFEKLLEQAGPKHDLSWFFADWVDADHGLPELSIESVFPSPAKADAWLVTVNLANNGYAAAEAPLIVRSEKTSVSERVLIPARGVATQRILIQGRPTQVQLNDGSVPETQASVHVKDLDISTGSDQ